MKLSVADRISLLSVLPTRGDYVTLKILTTLRLGLGLSEDEFEKWGIVADNATNRVSWKENGVAEIPIGEVATGIIVDTLRELDKSKKLPFDLCEIYEKFIPTTE